METKVIYLSEKYSHDSNSLFEALNVDKKSFFKKLHKVSYNHKKSLSDLGASIIRNKELTGDELTLLIALGAKELTRDKDSDFMKHILKSSDTPKDFL